MQEKNGDLSGSEFIERNRMTMLRIARAELARKGDPDPEAHAEDVVNEVSISILSKWPTLKSPPHAMYVFTVHEARTHARRRRREVASEIYESDLPMYTQPGLDPDKALEHVELIEAAFLALNDREQEVIELRYLHGLPFGDIAVGLDVPLGTVTSMCTRALAKMRAALNSLDAPIPPAKPDEPSGAGPLVSAPEV